MLWQKTNHPIELSYPKIMDQKIDYIHDNPTTAGLVNDETAWRYSSANTFQKLPLTAS